MSKHRYRENIPAENNAEECIIAGEIIEITPEEVIQEDTVPLDNTIVEEEIISSEIEVKVISDKLNVRKLADKKSDVLKIVNRDEILKVTPFDNIWYKLSDGGFVMKEFTK